MTFHFRTEANAGEAEVTVTNFVIPYVQWGMKNPSNFLLKVNDKVEIRVQAVGRIR